MIIVEGPDGGGKSTLVRKLAAEHRLMVCSTRGKPPKKPREYAYKALAAAASGNGVIRIYDRLFYSELVYGSILRNGSEFNDTERQYYYRMLQAMRTPVIFCLPPLDVVKDNVERSEQMLGVSTHIEPLYEMYWAIANEQRGDRPYSYIYNYTADRALGQYQLLSARVGQYITERKARTWR